MPGPLGNLAAYLTRAVEEGLSANAAYSAVKGTELGIRRASFLQAFKETREAVTNRALVAGLPGNVPIPNDAITIWQHATPNQYLHQVQVLVRQPGTLDFEPHYVTIASPDPMTPDEAVGQAVDIWDAATRPGGTGEGQVIGGGILTGVYASL